MTDIDLKATLNLPATDFPMKANLSQREPAILAKWQDLAIYRALLAKRANAPMFILHDGPPYANGAIHLGHALGKTLKDIVVKSKLLSGFRTPFVPGWDCHGLPIELNVEKKLGKAGGDLTPKKFRQACREYAASQVTLQSEAFQRLGVFGDWEHPYLTMDYTYEADIIRTLAGILANGHIHRGYKPVHWCMDCGSALAEAEVEYAEKVSPAIDVAFPLVDSKQLSQRLALTEADLHGAAIVIWTTTPWTLPANQAVAVHADFDYVLVAFNDAANTRRCVLLAEALLADAMKRYGVTDYQVLGTIKGQALAGLILHHPLYPREVPIILGDHVTLDAGTGAVHTAPAHGQEDYIVGLQYGLPVDHAVLPNGCFNAELPLFGGLHVLKANPAIIEALAALGHLVHQDKLNHSYPHCWRHKTPLIFRSTPQWFISMEQAGLREQALNDIGKVSWFPEWGQARITDMIAKRPDWCISRQRNWGVPLPFIVHKENDGLHPRMQSLLETIAMRVEQSGVDAWFDLDLHELIGDEAKDYYKINDTLDVWFDSGASFHAVLDARKDLGFPADLYLEGSDQHRGWFHSSLLASVAMKGAAPYRQVLTHGFTVDAKGRKMSKSLGNTVAPDKVINTLGADILRLWSASTDYRGEVAVSDEILQRSADAYRRIRNTARFLLANLHGFDPKEHQLIFDDLLCLDQYIIAKAHLLQQEIRDAYDSYQFHAVVQKIHHFCSIDLGSFYLDIIKDRQYTMPTLSRGRLSAQTALYHLVEALVRWLAPILSFTAEEIWQHMPGEREASVFFCEWYDKLQQLPETSTYDLAYWQRITDIRDEVNKALEVKRAEGIIGSGLEADVIVYAGASRLQDLTALGEELRFVFITSGARVLPENSKPDDALATSLSDVWLHVAALDASKCERCWHRQSSVGQDSDYPTLCSRCITNISKAGEQRCYA